MRKILIAAAAAAMLSACASVPTAHVTGNGSGQTTGFATLAKWGTWEAELAPTYTRLATLRHRGTRQLDARRISVTDAIEIQAKADRARQLLDASRRGDAIEPSPEQRVMLVEAQHLIYQAEQLLEH